MTERYASSPPCPLCVGSESSALDEIQGRRFYSCVACGLVHVSPSDWLTPEAERAHYQLHENDPADVRYRRFLDRLAVPLLTHLQPGMVGLDYGSGPGPTLPIMLQERGFDMAVYDPFFSPDPRVLDGRYDFVTCTEVAEHFFSPRREFTRFTQLLRPGGVLAVMTEVLDENRVFSQWSYARDPTHVCFYREMTLTWLATFMSASLTRPHANVALFQFSSCRR